MAKVLITADVHVSNYRNYNLFDNPEFRLQQFKKLSQRLVSILQERPDIEAVVIAGDFLHVAAPRPYVTNKAFEFLNKIAEWCPVYLTHGQHDIDTRRTGITENTLLSLCNHNKSVHYLHKETVTLGGCEFYFLGWVPNTEEEFGYLEMRGGTDVLIGHFQPGTVRVGQRNFLLSGGRAIPDNPPWKIAFVGDVHTHQVAAGNIVVPGVPLQHSFNDDPCPGVLLFDTADHTWERIETIVPGQWDFLRFIISDDHTLTNEWTVVRPQTHTQTTKLQKTFEKKLDIGTVIDDQVVHHGLDNLHRDVLSYVSGAIRQEVDLNFALEKLVIHDFRSIHHFEWESMGEGVKLLFGQNGTGKSSLITALMFALSGEGSGRTLTRKGCTNMYVEVTLLYGQFRHTLRRGWSTSGNLRYWINDVEQQAENQRALLEKIGENLPFLRFTDLIYHQQERPGFLSSYNYSARVDLISRVLGLQIVQALYEEAQRRVLDFDRQLANLRAKIATVNAIVEQEALVDFTFMEMIDDGKEANLKTLRDSIKSLVKEERRKCETTSSKKTTLVNRIQRETQEVADSERRREKLARRACYTCGQDIDDAQYEALYVGVSEEIATKKSDLEEWRYELDTLEVPSTELVDKLEARLEDVLHRLSEITSMREHHSKLLQLKTRIETAKNELYSLGIEQNRLIAERERVTDYKTLLDPTGPIMRTLLMTLSDMLSSETLRVRAHKQLVSGEIRPDFSVDVCISGSWIPYDELSGGQKTLTDLMVLEKLIQLAGGLGLIIFDETFKFLDGENLEKVVDLLKHMHCSSIFIVSHVEGFPYWDASIHTSLDENSATRYTIR